MIEGRRVLRGIEIVPDRKEVLRLLGIRGTKRAPRPSMMAVLDEEAALAGELLEPTGVLAVGEPGQEAPFGEPGWLAMAVVTIGPKLEERVRVLSEEGSAVRAMVLDALGSAAVEGLADWSNGLLCERLDQGATRGLPRTSPGYPGLALEAQRVLFRALEPEEIGVELNDHLMMLPRKSVSYVIRSVSGEGDRARPSRCSRCGLRDCAMRE